MKNISKLSMFHVTLLASAALPFAAQAQDAAAPPAAEASTADASSQPNADQGDIVVTARKRSERLVDVPVAVSVLGAQELARYASSNLDAVGAQIPQVMFTRNPSGNGANINIRGVGTNTSADDGIEQAVSVNVDGVPTARGRILQTGLFDISNVQVLKGPQALYYGKNSPGGTIVIESNGPTSTWTGYARGAYEFKAREYSSEGAVSGPLTDTLGIRVAARAANMDRGYVHNIAQPISAAQDPIAFDRANGLSIPGAAFDWGPNSKQAAGRLTLRWEPEPAFNATFKFLYSYYRDQGDASQNVIASCVPGQSHASTTDLSAVFTTGRPNSAQDPNSYCGGDRRVSFIGELPAPLLAGLPFNKGDSEFTRNRNYLSSLSLNYTHDDVTITSLTGFYKYSNVGNSFFDSNSLSLAGGGANSFYTSWNQELRLNTAFHSPFNFMIGAFYGRDRRTYQTWSDIIRDLNPVNNISVTSTTVQRTRGTTFSLFGELSYKPAPEFEFTGGARYTYEAKDGTLLTDYVSPKGAALRVSAAQGSLLRGRLRNDNISPQATATWHPTPNSSVYVGYRAGFKAGAITNPGLVSLALNNTNIVLRPEKVHGFEGGYKFETEDRRLTGDLAIYRYIYRDLQVSAFDSVSNTVVTQNAGGSKVEGVEATLNYRASDALSLHAAGGYNRARYTTFTNAACFGGQTAAQGCVNAQQNLTGQRLPRAPDWTGSAGANFDMPVSSNLAFSASGDVRYSSSYNFVSTNNPFAIQNGRVTVDASVRLADVDKRWELALIGRNLTNKFYFVVGSERPLGTSPGSVQGVPGNPRTIQLQATVNF